VHFRPGTRNLNNIGDVNNVINSINHCVFNDLRPFVVLKVPLVNCILNKPIHRRKVLFVNIEYRN